MDIADIIACSSIFAMFSGMVLFTYYKYRSEQETPEQYKQRQENIAAIIRTSKNNNPALSNSSPAPNKHCLNE